MNKKYIKLKEKYENLFKENKKLKNSVILLKTKQTINEQNLIAIKSAFELSQKLTQHLKTENSLLRTAQELITINTIEHQINNNIIISDNEMSIENSDRCVDTNISNNSNGFDSNLCKSDLIANQYETDIKEWIQESELLNILDMDYIDVSVEDQNNANQYLSQSDDEEVDEESDYQINRQFEENQSISLNPKSNESQIKIKCKTCGKKFVDEEVLNEHKSNHKTDDENRIKCAESDCNFICDSKHELKDHLKQVHRNRLEIKPKQTFDKSLLKIKLNENPVIKKSYDCHKCEKKLSSMQSLRQHQRLIHGMISWFKCKFSGCEQKFEKVVELRAHEEYHRQHPEEVIKKSVKQKPKIDQTQIIPEISQYFTQINGQNITSNGIPIEVIPAFGETQHQTERPYKCHYEGCNTKYKQKHSLAKHIAKYHSTSASGTIDLIDNDSNSEKPLDMDQRLQLLNMFYAEQQSSVLM